MNDMPVRNLVVGESEWNEGTVPAFGKRLRMADRSARVTRTALLNQNMTVLRANFENFDAPLNEPFRVRCEGATKAADVWRTPLELAIEVDAPDKPEMVEYLLQRGAQLSAPALRIALMVIDRNLRGIALGHALSKNPTPLMNTLAQAGAQWDTIAHDNAIQAARWSRIQAHYAKQESDVERRLTNLRQMGEVLDATGEVPAPRPRRPRI